MSDFFQEFKHLIWLAIICVVSFFVYCLKAIDADENKEKAKGYIWRKMIIGGIGNVIIIVSSFYIMRELVSWDDTLILCVVSGLGYIGADTIFKIIEKALEKYFLNKAGG